MPSLDDLRRYVDEARIKTLENLLKKAQEGVATASEYTVLLKVAKEVEELIPHAVRGQLADKARELLAIPEEDIMFAKDDNYDPNTPLDQWPSH